MNTLKIKNRKPTIDNKIGSIFDTIFKPDFFGGIDPYHRSPYQKPPVNISESETFYKLEFSIPGREKTDFKIEIEDGILIVSGDKKAASEEISDQYKRMEFHYESFKRTFALPEEVDDSAVEGKYENGILSVVLPKTAKAIKAKKQIEIS